MIEASVRSGRGETFYWISRNSRPDAKTLVLTHGLTADHTMFDKQVDYFATDCTVIVWDIPMHGRSRPYSDFSYRNAAEELNAILEAESIEKAVHVGMSLGGYVTQHFALSYPGKVEGLVAIGTSPLDPGYYSRSDIRWLKLAAPMCRLFPAELLRRTIASGNSATPYGRSVLLTTLSGLDKRTICDQIDIAYGKFVEELHDTDFDFPVLLMMGDKDRTGKVRVYTRQWAQNTGYPLRIIGNAAHLCNCDNPDEVNAAISGFLECL